MNSNAIVSDIISDAPVFIKNLPVDRVLEVVGELKSQGFFIDPLDMRSDINLQEETRQAGPVASVAFSNRTLYREIDASMNEVIKYLVDYGINIMDVVGLIRQHIKRLWDGCTESAFVDHFLYSALAAMAIGLHYEDNEDEYEEANKPEPKAVRVRVMVEVYVDGQLVEDHEVADAYANYHGHDDEDFDDEMHHELCGLDSEVADVVARALED